MQFASPGRLYTFIEALPMARPHLEHNSTNKGLIVYAYMELVILSLI